MLFMAHHTTTSSMKRPLTPTRPPVSPALVILCATLLAAGAAPPRNLEKKTTALPEVVVTATRSAADPLHTPALVSLRTQLELEQRLARSVPDALWLTPGVAVQKTASGQGSPIIRGFTGYRTLALVDGIRYNHSAYRDGPNEYFSLLDVQSLDRMELVHGPASVLYGSDAVGGALALFTRGSGFAEKEPGAWFQNGSLFTRLHSSEQSWQTRGDYHIGEGGAWGLHLGGTWKDFGKVRAADLGELPFTGFTQRSYDARFDARLAENWTLTLAHQALAADDVWRTHATLYAVPFAGSAVGTDRRRVTDYARSLSYARVRGEDLQGLANTAQITLSWQTLEEDLDRVRSNRVREFSTMDIGTLGLDAQFTTPLGGGTLTWGADYYRDRVDTARTDYHANGTVRAIRVQGPVGDDARYDLFGLYAQQEMPLGTRGTTLLAGARYTYASADIGKYEDPLTAAAASLADDWSNFSASLRLLHTLDSAGHLTAYGGLSQAFRAPNLGDLSRLGASRSDEIESAAANLEPETFLNFEIGLKHRSERVRVSAAAYYTVLDDYITSTPTGRIIDGQRQVTKQNSAEGYVRGVQGELEYDLSDQWTVFAGLAWTEGEADAFVGTESRREPLSRIPPLTGHYGLRWKSRTGMLSAELAGTTAARADELNTADAADTQRIPPGGTPGYTLLNLRATWQVNDTLTLHAGLDNLLDEAYRVHGSGTNEPGLGAVIGARFSF